MSEPLPKPPSLRREIVTAYAASAAKVVSCAGISAIVYRQSPADLGMLALGRGTIGILNYTSIGLGPGMVRVISAIQRSHASAAIPASGPQARSESQGGTPLDY